ncbi:MAG: type II toxin-antitoxin system Phd/YefM family antitoxin [Clostridiales bacterium]|nr:type II toxin-antitoxin system Phd/YefM family antitoxin [Clostridiales bacterium]
MLITATELKSNLGKYLALAINEDIMITKNGKIIAKLSNPYYDKVQTAKNLIGAIPSEMDVDDIKAERTSRI